VLLSILVLQAPVAWIPAFAGMTGFGAMEPMGTWWMRLAYPTLWELELPGRTGKSKITAAIIECATKT
jgi:hypothetical protein